jgi:hypothetical protein
MSYVNSHIAISRGELKTGVRNPSISVSSAPVPSLCDFLEQLHKVGGKYDWHKRPKYLDFVAVQDRLKDDETQFFEIKRHGIQIGYVLATKLEGCGNSIEIENFGLYPAHTGHDYGDTALPMALEALLEDYEHVYLTTRSTNHPKVVPFYQRHGMRLLDQETLPNDIMPDTAFHYQQARVA